MNYVMIWSFCQGGT